MNHTPTPWQLSKRGEIERASTGTPVGVDTDGKNAAFIVRACNAHEALVEALQGVLQLLPAESQGEGPSAWPEKARAVLKLARPL